MPRLPPVTNATLSLIRIGFPSVWKSRAIIPQALHGQQSAWSGAAAARTGCRKTMTGLLPLFLPTSILYMFTRIPREEDRPMKFKTLVLAGSLTLSAPVHAAELFTPTLWAVAPDAL